MSFTNDIKQRILQCLKNAPDGLTIEEIKNLTKISRNTASKYLHILEARGEVKARNIGKAKLFKITKTRTESTLYKAIKLLLITKFGEKFLEEVEVIDTEKGVKIHPLKPLGPKFRELYKIVKELQGTFNSTDNSFLIPFTTSE